MLASVIRDLTQEPVEVSCQVMDSLEAARLGRLFGSPTILIDGNDPFADDTQNNRDCAVVST
jgi:hypothetical protein